MLTELNLQKFDALFDKM